MLQTLSNCVGQVLYKLQPTYFVKGNGLEPGTRQHRPDRTFNTHHSNLELTASFPQTFSSTALAFGGVGGQAMTTAQITIIQHRQTGYYYCFCDSQYMYTVYEHTLAFDQAISNRFIDNHPTAYQPKKS